MIPKGTLYQEELKVESNNGSNLLSSSDRSLFQGNESYASLCEHSSFANDLTHSLAIRHSHLAFQTEDRYLNIFGGILLAGNSEDPDIVHRFDSGTIFSREIFMSPLL